MVDMDRQNRLEALAIGTLIQQGQLFSAMKNNDPDSVEVSANATFIDKFGLTEDDFYCSDWRDLFVEIKRCRDDGVFCTKASLGNRLNLSIEVEPGGRTLEQLIDSATRYAYHEFYPQVGKDLREATAFRLLSDLPQQISMQQMSLEQAISYTRQTIEQIEDRELSEDTSSSFGDIARQIVADIQQGIKPEYISTGLQTLNSAFGGGYERGDLVIFAGRTSMGKSLVVQSLAMQQARHGQGVLMFPLEMTRAQLGYRALSDLSYSSSMKIPHVRIKSHDLNDSELWAVGEAAARFHGMPFVISDQRGVSIEDIAAEIRRQKRKFENNGRSLDVVIVDHIGLIRMPDRYRGNRNNEVGEVTSGLLEIAGNNDVVIIAVSQLNRKTEDREDKRPKLADLRDSGNLEQDASAVVFVYRPAYYLERVTYDDAQKEMDRQELLRQVRNTVELILGKARHTSAGAVTLFCDAACNVVRDAA